MKIGDTVALKSFGPPMTIIRIDEALQGNLQYIKQATCMWFDENYILREAVIPIEALEPFECECDHNKSNKEEVNNLQN